MTSGTGFVVWAVLEEDGALADLVPTCLWLMGIPPGQGMTGRNLVRSV